MSVHGISIGQELLDVPMGDMIREMAMAIADAQIRLDENSIEVAEMMGGLKTIYDANGNVTFEDSRMFFGREKVTLQTAIELYNASEDPRYKGRIETGVLKGTSASHKDDVKKKGGTGPDKDNYEVKSDKTAKKEDQVSIPVRLSMMEIGFSPTFYQFVDTIIEVRISISMKVEKSASIKIQSNSRRVDRSASISWNRGLHVRRSKTVTTTQVNAAFASKYSYSAEGSSLLRTKLTPIPPPAILEERIRRLMEDAE